MTLSKPALLILGIIEERRLNPYEIVKLLSAMPSREWAPIAGSTVYATIKALESKAFISGIAQKEGNMPEKTVYSLTPAGRLQLQKDIAEYLTAPRHDPAGFNIAASLICHIGREQALELLDKRLFMLYRAQNSIKYGMAGARETRHPIALAVMRHDSLLLDAGIEAANKLIDAVKNHKAWDYRVSFDITARQENEIEI